MPRPFEVGPLHLRRLQSAFRALMGDLEARVLELETALAIRRELPGSADLPEPEQGRQDEPPGDPGE